MIIIQFLDPRKNLEPASVGIRDMPREEQLYAHIQEGLRKAVEEKKEMITVDIGFPDGRNLKLPNVFNAMLTEEKNTKIITPDQYRIPAPNENGIFHN